MLGMGRLTASLKMNTDIALRYRGLHLGQAIHSKGHLPMY